MSEPGSATTSRISVLLVDDQVMFAQSVARTLSRQPDIEMIGVAHTAADGIVLAEQVQPDVAVVDYKLPDLDGASLTRRIRAVSPNTSVLMLTGLTEERLVLATIEAGGAGFLTKDKAVDELVAAVRILSTGEAYIAHATLVELLPRLRRGYQHLGAELTRREREILELMVNGIETKSIATRLGLRVNTVRNHIQHILMKLDAHSKLEAVAIALREGLVSRP